jgi:hypothetical protein
MCLLKFLYYYTWNRKIPDTYKKEITENWKSLDKMAGICNICNKYSASLIVKNKICYRCFEDKYND